MQGIVKKLQDVLTFAFENPYSSFYRDKYGSAPPACATLTDIAAIPFLAREEIANVPFWKRIFYPRETIENIRVTSGTSGRGVLLMPRQEAAFYGVPRGVMQGAEHIKRLGMHRTLTTTGAYFQYERSYRETFGMHMMSADMRALPITARLAKLFSIDSVAGFPYAMTELAPHLSREDVAQIIKAVELFGEKASPTQEANIKEAYPHAHVFAGYASIEAQSVIAQPCSESLAHGGEDVHAVEEYFFVEFIDGQKPVLSEGSEGEIVITSLRPLAFPLIRYRTGDTARITSLSCPCGAQTPRFSIVGRIDADRLRVAGGEISLAEAHRALKAIGLSASSIELTYLESSPPRIDCGVFLSRGTTTSPLELARRFAEEFRLTPGTTYARLVAEGRYGPLTMRFLLAPGKSAVVRRSG